MDELGPAPLTHAQERITGLVRTRVEALVRHSFADLGRWQTMLRSMANQLEDLETRAKRGQRDGLPFGADRLDLGDGSVGQPEPKEPTEEEADS